MKVLMRLGQAVGRQMDRGPHLVVGAAAADVGDVGVDVGVGGLGLVGEQCGSGHDHAGLAIAALRDVERQPCLLHRVRAVA